MKYRDLVDSVLAKLNLTYEEAKYDNVLNKIVIFCNEGLDDIANRGKPFYKTLIIDLIDSSVPLVLPDTLIDGEIVIYKNRFITFPPEFISLTNEYIQRVSIKIDGRDMSIIEDGSYERVDGRFFRRLSSKQLLFPDLNYRYLVPCVFRYPRIKGIEDNEELDIDLTVLNLLPNYIVSEILRVDDVTLSLTYRNLYEASLAQMNDTVLDPAGDLYNEDY